MPLPTFVTSTRVTFPQGHTSETSRILHTATYTPGHALVFTEVTPFHPVSHSWPDQQADLGIIATMNGELRVVDTLTAAINPVADDARLYLDKDIPVRKTESGWIFLVAHVVELPEGGALEDLQGKTVKLTVDGARRKGLSATHTATHLVALALNAFTSGYWRKDAPKDPLGNPDLDRLAMQRSTITATGCTDHYRFGKSLRKKGFDSSLLFDQIDGVRSKIAEQVEKWIKTGSAIVIDVAGPTLESARFWTCELEGQNARFPCGGTHLRSLSELDSIDVSIVRLPGLPELEMHTVAKLKE